MTTDTTSAQTGDRFAVIAAKAAYGLMRDEGTPNWDQVGADERQYYADHFAVVLAAVQPEIAAEAEKRAEDRIVKWLRGFSSATGRKSPSYLAAAIERGEHRG